MQQKNSLILVTRMRIAVATMARSTCLIIAAASAQIGHATGAHGHRSGRVPREIAAMMRIRIITPLMMTAAAASESRISVLIQIRLAIGRHYVGLSGQLLYECGHHRIKHGHHGVHLLEVLAARSATVSAATAAILVRRHVWRASGQTLVVQVSVRVVVFVHFVPRGSTATWAASSAASRVEHVRVGVARMAVRAAHVGVALVWAVASGPVAAAT